MTGKQTDRNSQMTEGPEMCNCNQVRRAARHLSRFYDLELAPTGLKATQHALLNHLAQIGPVTMARLAKLAAMDRATIGHNLHPLEREGLVSVTILETDRRSRLVSITSEGRQRLRRARPYWRQAQVSFEKAFGSEQAMTVRELMERIVSTSMPDTRTR
jgi:DNA-binding MarR family transcriptional regulator